MKSHTSRKLAPLMAFALTLTAANAAVILRYDSTTSSATQLSVVGTTDASLVSAADTTTSIDGTTVEAGPHPSQTNVQGTLGNQTDLNFRFGGDNSTISYALTPANALTGFWIGTSFTAAQDMQLDQLTFLLFVNSQNGTLFAARDVGLFASTDGGTSFSQFGDLRNGTNTGNQGVVTFNDTLAIASGGTVELRLLFSDKTSSANNLQASTRVGDIIISGSAVPEPSTALLGALGALMLIRRRR